MNMLQEIESYQDDRRVLQVACAKCRQWIANARVGELELPLKGHMFERRLGCDHWTMPGQDAEGMSLLCPMSIAGDPQDLHLFIPAIPGRENEADTLYLYGSAETYTVIPKDEIDGLVDGLELCPCGCGEEVKIEYTSGKLYATAQCHTRWVFQQEDRS